MTTEDTLARAADLLERTGWCQKEWKTSDGKHCLLGALATVIADDDDLVHWRPAQRALKQEIGTDNLITWNNTPGRIAEEVIGALRNSKRHL